MQARGLKHPDAPDGGDLLESTPLGVGDDPVLQDAIQETQVHLGGVVIRSGQNGDVDGRT